MKTAVLMLWCGCGCAAAAAVAGAARAEEPAGTPPVNEAPPMPAPADRTTKQVAEEWLGLPIRGEFSNRFRYRRMARASDDDFIQFLRLGIGDEATDTWTYDVAARMAEDVDGNLHTRGYYAFDELGNSHGGSVTARLYTATATGHGVAGLDQVRIGRQEISGPEALYFDGVRVDGPALADLGGLRLTAYGGIPVHLYESPVSDDWLAGAEASLQPTSTTTLTGQYAYISDEFSLYGHPRTNLEVLRWVERISTALSTEARMTFLDSRGREAALTGTWREAGWFAQAGYRRLMQQQKAYATDVDPYVGLLTVEQPYHQFDARASRQFGEWFSLSADGTVRTLVSEGTEGEFNRDYTRFSIVPVFMGWPDPGSEWTLSATGWEAEKTRFITYGGEYAQAIAKPVLVRLGSDYSLYKFDLFTDTERTHARTFYLKLRWNETDALRWDLGVEQERNDDDTFRKVELSARYRF